MASSFKDKLEKAGHQISETATKVGHTVGEKVEEVTDWAKEKAHAAGHRIEEVSHKAEHKMTETFGETGPAGTLADIREHMDVISSCGTHLGKVDHVEADSIKLTKKDSPDGMHHLIPKSWVQRVDEHVHLSKDCSEARSEWKAV